MKRADPSGNALTQYTRFRIDQDTHDVAPSEKLSRTFRLGGAEQSIGDRSIWLLGGRRSNDFLGGIGQADGADDVDATLGQNLTALLDFRPFKSYDQRHIEADVTIRINEVRWQSLCTA